MQTRILVVDDDPFIHKIMGRFFSTSLTKSEVLLIHSESPEAARIAFELHGFHIAFIDLNYGKIQEDGFSLIESLKKIDPRIQLIVLSNQNDFRSAQRAFRAGASDFLAKGFGEEELLHVFERALERRNWKVKDANIVSAQKGVSKILGATNEIKKIKEQILKVARTELSVLIEAETGAGKEVVARAIHEESHLQSHPFVAVNCGAIPSSLSDSFFFGHEKGAFTGANSLKEGVFEQVDGGTLFLDEINSLQLDMQAKLLRVLQEREFRRLGSNKVRNAQFRLVAASNVSLEKMIEKSEFREDLYYRINSIMIQIPPLRERDDDIVLLTENFLPGFKLDRDLLLLLKNYWWPGNIRELRNMLQVIQVLAGEERRVGLDILPEHMAAKLKGKKSLDASSIAKIRAYKEKEELKFFRESYKAAGGNISKLARQVSMDRSYLHQKLVKLGIHKPK